MKVVKVAYSIGMRAGDAVPGLFVSPRYQPMLRELGIDVQSAFEHPDIKPWRTLADRENCVLDAILADGRRVRWHVKRYAAVAGRTPAEKEAEGIRLLTGHGIPTVEMVAYGKLADGHSVLILGDLAGYVAGDKWLEEGVPVADFVDAVAILTANLHQAGLRHRDLYFCHFMLRNAPRDVRLIDAARVAKLPRGPTRFRWIVKDLSQLWYSLSQVRVERQKILDKYMQQMKWGRARQMVVGWLVRVKSRSIARHDIRLRRKQPQRNISIPS